MMHAIVGKLKTELTESIRTERQVVYILVELRKLLELHGELDAFPSLTFHCDWAVHPLLHKRTALEVLGAFNTHVADYDRLSKLKMGESIMSETSALGAIASMENFRLDLTNCFQKYDLPLALTEDSGRWGDFIKYYGAVIADCPLRCKAKNMPFVDEVLVEVADLKKETTDLTGFTVKMKWTWTNKVSGEQEHMPMFF